MKTTIHSISTRLFVLSMILLSSLYAVAQDAGSTQSSSNVSHTESSVSSADTTMWYSNPIIWAVGAVVLLIIIIAAARSGKRKVSDREVSRTTTTTTTVKED